MKKLQRDKNNWVYHIHKVYLCSFLDIVCSRIKIHYMLDILRIILLIYYLMLTKLNFDIPNKIQLPKKNLLM